ncbi:hypothetical protein GF324_14115 [bacterium]|nr:hypothetical protein [bacterium]
MARIQYHFMSEEDFGKLEEFHKSFIASDLTPENYVVKLREMFTLDKAEPATWKRRVEALYTASEMLFHDVLEEGRTWQGTVWNRGRVVIEARLMPLSHYHWTTGSREPTANLLTRDDYLNDPATALIKLEFDIISMGKLLRRLQNRDESLALEKPQEPGSSETAAKLAAEEEEAEAATRNGANTNSSEQPSDNDSDDHSADEDDKEN